MIISGHIVPIVELNHMLKGESLLILLSNFISAQSISGDEDIDGNYVVVDIKQDKVIRSGMVAVGMFQKSRGSNIGLVNDIFSIICKYPECQGMFNIFRNTNKVCSFLTSF